MMLRGRAAVAEALAADAAGGAGAAWWCRTEQRSSTEEERRPSSSGDDVVVMADDDEKWCSVIVDIPRHPPATAPSRHHLLLIVLLLLPPSNSSPCPPAKAPLPLLSSKHLVNAITTAPSQAAHQCSLLSCSVLPLAAPADAGELLERGRDALDQVRLRRRWEERYTRVLFREQRRGGKGNAAATASHSAACLDSGLLQPVAPAELLEVVVGGLVELRHRAQRREEGRRTRSLSAHAASLAGCTGRRRPLSRPPPAAPGRC